MIKIFNRNSSKFTNQFDANISNICGDARIYLDWFGDKNGKIHVTFRFHIYFDIFIYIGNGLVGENAR